MEQQAIPIPIAGRAADGRFLVQGGGEWTSAVDASVFSRDIYIDHTIFLDVQGRGRLTCVLCGPLSELNPATRKLVLATGELLVIDLMRCDLPGLQGLQGLQGLRRWELSTERKVAELDCFPSYAFTDAAVV